MVKTRWKKQPIKTGSVPKLYITQFGLTFKWKIFGMPVIGQANPGNLWI